MCQIMVSPFSLFFVEGFDKAFREVLAVAVTVYQNNSNITFIEKFNFYLIRIFEYLKRFRIEIKYKSNKINIILNVLLKLINRILYRFEKNFLIFNFIDFF